MTADAEDGSPATDDVCDVLDWPTETDADDCREELGLGEGLGADDDEEL